MRHFFLGLDHIRDTQSGSHTERSVEEVKKETLEINERVIKRGHSCG